MPDPSLPPGARVTASRNAPGRFTPHASPLTRSAGFTLLEVLVALAVLALALGALIRAGAEQAATVDHLRDRTFAGWVASDRLAALRLETSWPDTGERRGSTRMGPAEWHWTLTVSGTEDPDMRRIEVAVRREPGDTDPVASLTGFAGRY